MLEAPNMFPDDPDAQQAFTDALPIVAELLNASARIPANSQAGRAARRNGEQQRAHLSHVQDLTEQLQLHADRIGISVNELLEQGTSTVKRQARESGLPRPGRPASIGRMDAGGSELRDKAIAAEEKYAKAVRDFAAAVTALAKAKDEKAFAWAARDEARRTLAAHEQSSLAA